MKTLSLLLLFLTPAYLIVNNPEEDQKEIFFDVDKAKENLDNVRVLDLSNKGYNNLPNDIAEMQNLEQLRLSGNNMKTLPNYFSLLTKLEILDIGNNGNIDFRQSIPSISKSKKLKKLYLNDCALGFIPSNIGELKKIETLDLSNNFIFELPYYMSRLTNLKHVDLSNNKLLELGYAPSLWTNLETIDLKGNDSLDVENALLALSYLKKLKAVSFSNVSKLPENISDLKCESVTFVNSKLTKIPETLHENKSIKTFNLEEGNGSNLKELFSEMAGMKGLEELRLSNCFDKIPTGLKSVHQIKRLDISNNDLATIKLKSADFPKLSVLKINGNNISAENVDALQKEFPNCSILVGNNITSVKQEKIVPPIENMQIEKAAYKVNPTKKKVLEYGSTKINIPKNAFVDEKGKVVKTPVDIEYREFHDPLDVILSGIPMGYDTVGKQTNLETAGMIEFRATSNGKEVFPNEKAIIQINMDSKRTEEGYNTYRFDEEKGNWDYVSPSVAEADEVVYVNPLTDYNFDRDFYMNARRLQKAKPTTGINNVTFSLIKLKGKREYRVEKEEFTIFNASHKKSIKSLEVFKKFKFIYDDATARETKKFLKKFNRSIDGYSASYLVDQYFEVDKENDCFNLVAEYIDTIIVLPLRVQANTINHERDQKKAFKFWKYYKKLKNKEDKANDAMEKKYLAAMTEYEKEIEKIQEANRGLIAKNNKQKASLTTVKRSFMLEGFGVWNCDRIGVAEEPIFVKAIFKDADGAIYNPKNVMVIDETDNGVITFLGGDISMDKGNNNAIVVTTDGDKIGFIRSRDVGLLQLKNRVKTVIPLTYISTKDVSIAELKTMIQS